MPQKHDYRVFISYSHQDSELVDELVAILRENGLRPMLDKDFAFGGRFTDQIRNFIAHAHVFVPVITESSSKRGWVHQEIGYAMALKVPVLPICRGHVPGEMISELQAVTWNKESEDLDRLKEQLSWRTFNALLRKTQKDSHPLYECARYHEDRTMMMVDYASKVLELGAYGHVLQIGALSSFHIPDKPISDRVWKDRYGSFVASDFRKQLLREERLVLEEHARVSGCSLIIDPYLSYEKYGPDARKTRLKTLLDLLNSMPDEKVRVAIKKGMPKEESLTIVGDWFTAESISASLGKGYQQTIFTRHAPTVQSRTELADRELGELLKVQGIEPYSSRRAAIAELEKLVQEIDGKDAKT